MKMHIDVSINGFEFWKLLPAEFKETKRVFVEDKKAVGRVKSALSQDMHEVLFHDDPRAPRYDIILHSDRKPVLSVEIINKFVLSGNRCYFSSTRELWDLLEGLKKTKKIRTTKMGLLEKPCFTE